MSRETREIVAILFWLIFALGFGVFTIVTGDTAFAIVWLFLAAWNGMTLGTLMGRKSVDR